MRRRKRIALFLGEIGRDYQKKFINELRKVARSKDYDIFVFNNFGAYNGTALFDLGERDVINIPVFSEFEGIISLADTYDIDGMEEMLLNRIRKETDCPVVSVRNGSHDTYRVVFDNFSTLYEMTDHFIKEHGFKNICYMSGPLSYEDSVRRLEGFKKAMSDAGLEVTDDILFEGDFGRDIVKKQLINSLQPMMVKQRLLFVPMTIWHLALWKCLRKEELKFQTISLFLALMKLLKAWLLTYH